MNKDSRRRRLVVAGGAAVAWGVVRAVHAAPIRGVLQPMELDVLLTAQALHAGASLDVVSGSTHGVEPGAYLTAVSTAVLLGLGLDPLVASRLLAGLFGMVLAVAVGLGASERERTWVTTRVWFVGALLLGLSTTFSFALEVFAVTAVVWVALARGAKLAAGVTAVALVPWVVVALLPGGDHVIAEKWARLPDLFSTRLGVDQASGAMDVGVVVVIAALVWAALASETREDRLWVGLAAALAVATVPQDGPALPYLLPAGAIAVVVGVGSVPRRLALPLAALCVVVGLLTVASPTAGQNLWVSVGTHRFVERPVGGRDGPRGRSGFTAVVGPLDLPDDEARSLGFGYGMLVGSTWVRNDAPEPERWHAGAADTLSVPSAPRCVRSGAGSRASRQAVRMREAP